MKNKYLDLRSDTVTQPTDEMRRAMFEAEVGDDVYQDDPTVNRLEEMAAAIMGKEAALFVVSGTMANQVSIMTHNPSYGNEIIVGAKSHIVHYECGAPARLSGVNFALVDNENTFLYAADVRRLVRPVDPHFPKTGLVCLENALCNGDVVPLDVIYDACAAAHEMGVPVHMDGARIFNAALALGCEAKDIARECESVSFCISKGLCAPIGALICGSRAFIDRARMMRKVVGGGMRQAGVIAACGVVSLEVMTKRLHIDHENARYLCEQLNLLGGITADRNQCKINMVFWKASQPKFQSDDFVAFMLKHDVKVYGILVDEYRFVTHNDISRSDIDHVIAWMKEYIASL